MEPAAAEHRQQLRSLRDFLLVYNRMTELCFRHCVCNLNYRLLTGREESCLESCAAKLVHANHRLVRAYVALMPGIVRRRAAAAERSAAGTGAPGASPDPAATDAPGADT
ncbi:mitochondrial import inner membrane translocase subunit Tim10 B [Colius striatus]|uniref:mitochondrial import inner membrane translocase subunit Tim10 B n=1 Tax=Colius striatus TaxID=57412 RepID=UPI002B1D2CF2|nr:mitochondrial import inner membrane translocase subunit Tim10 B [Colius striatus]